MRVLQTALIAGLLVMVILLAGSQRASAQEPQLTGNVPSSGVALVSWSGGSVDELLTVAGTAGCFVRSLWVSNAGMLTGYLVGAPTFANAGFLDLYPGANLPEATALILVCAEVPTAGPSPGTNDLVGTVVDSTGQPIDGVNIALELGSTRVDVISGADGSWRTELPMSGAWTWSVVGVRCTSRLHNTDCENESFFLRNPRGVVSVPGDPGPTVVYEIATHSVIGKVVDLASDSIVGVAVHARRGDGARSFIRTDASGEFSAPAGAGTWTIWATLGQLVSPSITVVLGVTPTSAPLTLQVPLESSIGGALGPTGVGTTLAVVLNGSSRAYDFRVGHLYPSPTEGDFYFAGFQPAAFWANNLGQRGLLDLGVIATPIDDVAPPTSGYSSQGVAAIVGHVYVSLAREGFEGEYIVFRVLSIETDGTNVLSYVLEYFYIES